MSLQMRFHTWNIDGSLTLNEADFMMQSVPLEFAFNPTSRCYITDVEILKRAGRINIEDMCLIQLMHPEYQIHNKLVSEKVLANAKICNAVADEQHGSRKHHQVDLLGLNKVLIGDNFRYTQIWLSWDKRLQGVL